MTIGIERAVVPSVIDAGLPTIDYRLVVDPCEAHQMLREARLQAPIAMGPYGPELLTYQLVHDVLRDPRFCVPPGFSLAAQGITSGPLWDRVAASLLTMDGCEHHRLRRLVAKAFAPRPAAGLRETIVDTITRLVDPLAATGHCDVVADIARQYPIPVICALLGTPDQDWERFSSWTDDMMKLFSWDAAVQAPAILRAWEDLDSYLEDMIAQRRDAVGADCPSGDLVSELLRAESDGDRLTHDELLMLVAGLLMAGTDTTRNQLAAAVQVLCDHPEQWALLVEHPELAPKAVEEIMRHSPVAFATMRTAMEDVELGGVTIPAGMVVVVNAGAANRDPAVFDEPDRLDITRSNAAPMLTFGGGVHYCLGSHLARAELSEALVVITSRMPNARRTAPAPWKPLTGMSGPTNLCIEFDAGH